MPAALYWRYAPMTVKRIALFAFRNIEAQELCACDGINIISGENGQGKTNILEAIGLFTGTRSFRGARNNQMIRHGKEFSRLKMDFYAQGRDQTARMTVTKDSRDTTINDVKQAAASSLIGRFCAVVFSPDKMMLVSGSASERRKFLDAAISQAFPQFASLLVKYNTALAQRNALLKKYEMNQSARATIDVWDTQISVLGSQIVKKRLAFIKNLSPSAERFYEGISSGREPLSLEYDCSFSSDLGCDDLEAKYLQCLRDSISSDVRAGFTQHGPHRDDLLILLGGNQARIYGSQGQKRSAVLALKLAEADQLAVLTGEQPVALLDDVMSELDQLRQDYLLNRLEGWQVFITCCDPGSLCLLDKGSIFDVCGGVITRTDKN